MKQLLLLTVFCWMGWSAYSQCSVDMTHSVSGATATFSLTESGFANGPDSYYYDFGDGNTLWGSSNPSHTYSANGTYVAHTQVMDSIGGCFAVDIDTVVINHYPPASCNLSFNLYDSIGYIGADNYSTGSSHYEWWIFDPSGNSYMDSTVTLAFPYNQSGTYTICLYGYDGSWNICDTLCQSITVNYNGGSANCDASFSYADSNGTVNFWPTGTSGFHWWDLGDGNTSSATYPMHTYTAAGTYTVCHIVSDSTCSDTTCTTITVTGGGANCDASFTYSTGPNNTVWFYANQTAGSHYWDMGNGQSHVGANATHAYASAGTYTVCHTVSNTGCTDTVCQTITISNAPCNLNVNVVDSAGYLYGDNYSTNTSTVLWHVYDPSGSIVYSDSAWNLSYQYGQAGTYTVCAEGYDLNGSFCDTLCQSITVGGSGPACNLNYQVFDSAGTIYGINNSTNVSYVEWYVFDPNGNVYVDSIQGVLTYPANTNGTYNVCLYAYDLNGSFCDSACTSVVISNGGPVACDAAFSYSDSAGVGYQFLPNTYWTNTNYFWDFGDGTTSTDVFPYHVYNTPGAYTVCLTVSNSAFGCTQTYCDSVLVTAPVTGCNAHFISFSDSSANTVYLWNLSSGSNLNYFWDFGDGTTSSDQFPMHTYQQNGVYNVCLTVWDNTGCSDTICETVSSIVKANGFHLNVVGPGAAVSVDEVETLSDLNFFPNPVSEVATVEISSVENMDATYRIVTLDGKVIRTEQVQLTTGSNRLNLNLGELSAGIYFLQIDQLVIRFMKQ